MTNLNVVKSIFQNYSEDCIQSVIKRKKTRDEVNANNQFWKDINKTLKEESVVVNNEKEKTKFELPSNKVN